MLHTKHISGHSVLHISLCALAVSNKKNIMDASPVYWEYIRVFLRHCQGEQYSLSSIYLLVSE